MTPRAIDGPKSGAYVIGPTQGAVTIYYSGPERTGPKLYVNEEMLIQNN